MNRRRPHSSNVKVIEKMRYRYLLLAVVLASANAFGQGYPFAYGEWRSQARNQAYLQTGSDSAAPDDRSWPTVRHIHMRLPILPERPHAGPMKPVESARTSQAILPNGQLELTVEHDTVRGVTPAMLRWWFETLGQTMSFEGKTYPRYLLWHPRDHIHWELAAKSPTGGAGQGARFRIVEAFAANPAYYVDSTEDVEKLDEEGISLVRRIAGLEVFRLEHRFGQALHGASYRSRMTVGIASGPFRGVFNAFVRPKVFPDAMGTAWLTHNVEEVSMLENILPALYAARPRMPSR